MAEIKSQWFDCEKDPESNLPGLFITKTKNKGGSKLATENAP